MTPAQIRGNIKLKYEIMFHVMFWAIHVGYRYMLSDLSLNLIITDSLYLFNKIAITYFTVYFLLYHLLLNKRFKEFVLYFFISAAATILLRQAITVYVIFPYNLYPLSSVPILFDWVQLFKSIIYIYPVVMLATLIMLTRSWYFEQKNKYLLINEKLKSELKYLKEQLHPHFLFNTINNIYSLSLEKSENTPDALLKLSDLLHFMLYECNSDKITLKKEVEILENYIELEKIRYSERLTITFTKQGDLNNAFVPPLLYLPLVENAFKHGASNSLHETWINVELFVKNDYIHFKVENSNDLDMEKKNKSGIGLSNLRKRLDIIYKSDYELKIINNPDSHVAELKISNKKPDQE